MICKKYSFINNILIISVIIAICLIPFLVGKMSHNPSLSQGQSHPSHGWSQHSSMTPTQPINPNALSRNPFRQNPLNDLRDSSSLFDEEMERLNTNVKRGKMQNRSKRKSKFMTKSKTLKATNYVDDIDEDIHPIEKQIDDQFSEIMPQDDSLFGGNHSMENRNTATMDSQSFVSFGNCMMANDNHNQGCLSRLNSSFGFEMDDDTLVSTTDISECSNDDEVSDDELREVSDLIAQDSQFDRETNHDLDAVHDDESSDDDLTDIINLIAQDSWWDEEEDSFDDIDLEYFLQEEEDDEEESEEDSDEDSDVSGDYDDDEQGFVEIEQPQGNQGEPTLLRIPQVQGRRRRGRPRKECVGFISKFVESSIQRHDVGDMVKECKYCHAKFFAKERPTKAVGEYDICCNCGKIRLPRLPTLNPPQHGDDKFKLLRELLNCHHTDAQKKARHMNFRKYTRLYNNALAMASVGADIQNVRGPGSLAIHGSVYHLIGNAETPEGQTPKFVQTYFIDPVMAKEILRGNSFNQLCNLDVLDSLFDMISQYNYIARKVQSMYHQVRDNPDNDSIRLTLYMDKSKDKRRYNIPTSGAEIGVVMINNQYSNDTDLERHVVIYAFPNEGSNRWNIKRIPSYSPYHDALSYPLLFIHGELGFSNGIRLTYPDDPFWEESLDQVISQYYEHNVRNQQNGNAQIGDGNNEMEHVDDLQGNVVDLTVNQTGFDQTNLVEMTNVERNDDDLDMIVDGNGDEFRERDVLLQNDGNQMELIQHIRNEDQTTQQHVELPDEDDVIALIEDGLPAPTKRVNVSMHQYKSYILQTRNDGSYLLHCYSLTQQFIIDSFITIEMCKQNYIRNNQKQIRKDRYNRLEDYIRVAAGGPDAKLGKFVFNTKGYTASPAYMKHKCDDAMAMFSEYGTPDLFITFTANPKWEEYKRLLEEFNLKQDQVAERVSKSRTAVTNSMRLLKLSDKVQQMIIDEMISTGHARAILSIEDPEEQYNIAQKIFDEKLSVREVEKLMKNYGKPAKEKKMKDSQLEVIYRDIEEKLKQKLGAKVAINSKGNGAGKMEIEFYTHDDLEKLVDMLSK